MTFTVIVETTARTLYAECRSKYVAERILSSIRLAMGERTGGVSLYSEYDDDRNGIGRETVVNPAHIVTVTIVEVDV